MHQGPHNYSAISRFFHWGMALLILGLTVAGFFMVQMDVSPFKFQIYGFHKSVGLVVLSLTFLRVAYQFYKIPPKPLDHYKYWEKVLSKTIHIVLYIAIFVMPLSGLIMSWAGDFPVGFFGLFEVPKLVPKDEFVFEVSRSVHETAAYAIIGCVALHVVGALKHHFIDGDVTLHRMGGRPVFGILAFLMLGLALSFAPQGWVVERTDVSQNVVEVVSDSVTQGEWVIDSAASKIGFSYVQYGLPVGGMFERFDGAIIFDPQNLAQSSARIMIDAGSIRTGSADRDGQARSDLWFDAGRFAEIVFESEKFVALEDANRFEVFGRLRIRDVVLPVSFPFSLKIEDADNGEQRADMRANLSLNRLDFGVGQGQWQATDAIENAVKIDISVQASRL